MSRSLPASRRATGVAGSGDGAPTRGPAPALASAALLLVAGLAACGGAPDRIVLATTTSTEDSGLLGVLVPAFEAANPPYTVEVVAVGTGAALELGKRGDADVVLVHDPEGEESFVADGHGSARCVVMRNDFVIVGPPDDPADLRDATSTEDALRRVVDAGVEWVSRGDDSGTHRRERTLWDMAETRPPGNAFLDVGQGMGPTLTLTSERRSYTLSDRSTFLFMMDGLDLDVLFEREPPLDNSYGVIPVLDAANPEGGRRFAAWLASADAQARIEGYGVERFGMPLFEALRPHCAFSAG